MQILFRNIWQCADIKLHESIFYLQTEVPYKNYLIIIGPIFGLRLQQGCVVQFGVSYVAKLENKKIL